MVLLPEVVQCEERDGLIISEVAQYEGDPAGVGEVAPVGAAGLAQLTGVVTEGRTTVGWDGWGETAQLSPVERVEVVVLEPHDQHGVVLLTDGAGVAGQLDSAPGHSVHHNCRVWEGGKLVFLFLSPLLPGLSHSAFTLSNGHPEWINVSGVKYYQIFLSARVEGVMPSYDYLCEDSHWTGLGTVQPSTASVCPVSGTSWWFLTSPPVTRIIIRRSSELPSRGWEMIEGDDNGVLGANTYQWSTFNNHLPSSTSRQLLSLASHIPLCLSRIQLTLSPTHSHILYVLTTFTQGSSIFKRFGSARK